MAGKIEPSDKGKDPDYSVMSYSMKATPQCTCTCACCASGHAGHVASGRVDSMSPLGVRPLGCEPEPIAVGALERRYEFITKVLLPQARSLASAMASDNQAGSLGHGELEILGTLQRWVLQLEIEQDELRLILDKPPPLGPQAP